MKKIAIALVFVLILQACFTITAQAATFEKPISGSVSKITYVTGAGNAGTLTIHAKGAALVNRELWSPDGTIRYYRLLIDLKNSSINTNGTLIVSSGSVAQIRYSQFDAVKTRFVMDLSTEPSSYEVKVMEDRVEVLINGGANANTAPASSATPTPPATTVTKPTPVPAATATPTPIPAATTPTPATSLPVAPVSNLLPGGVTITSNSATKGPVSWTLAGTTCTVNFAGIDLPALVAQGKAIVENRPAQKQIQITLKGIDSRFIEGVMPGNTVLYGVLVSHNSSRNTTIIRLSGRTAMNHALAVSGTNSVMSLTANTSFISGVGSFTNLINNSIGHGNTSGSNGSTASSVSTGTTGSAGSAGTSTGTIGSSTGSTGSSTGSTGSSAGSTGSLPNMTPVADATTSRGGRTTPVTVTTSANEVTFLSDDVTGSRVFRLGKTIVIDMPGVAVNGLQSGNSALVRNVSVTSADGRLRAVITSDGFSDWVVTETAGRLSVSLVNVPVANMEGGDDADVVLRLVGAGIGERYRTAAELVKVDDDIKTNTFTFMFPATVITLGNGVFQNNNPLAKNVSVLSTAQSSFISIAKGVAGTQFRIVPDTDGNGLTIRKSVLEAPVAVPAGTSRLVVLDAGHGGTDPGAVFEGLYESHVNLDITLRAEAILKARGIHVMLTRSSDKFVGLEERTVIANNANASLFVSIHQNSMPEGMRGTMTMYYSSSVNGKNYAQIMQDTLSPALGLGNIGLRSSSELIVLRKTKMPAILAEAACMSSPLDMAVIKTDAFRQNAAQAIADGVVKILGTMR